MAKNKYGEIIRNSADVIDVCSLCRYQVENNLNACNTCVDTLSEDEYYKPIPY